MRKLLIMALFLFTFLFPSSGDVGDIKMSEIISPIEPLSTRWTFIVDGSSSLWYKPRQNTCKMLNKSRLAFILSISQPSDDLKFSIFLFGDKNYFKYKKWQSLDLRKKPLDNLLKWLQKGAGTFSHGKRSIELALHQKITNLSIILITDGGFSSACYGRGFDEIEKTIIDSQAWRLANGLNMAIIRTIGLENRHYTAGGKPNDVDCQAFLKKIGTRYHGGYWLVTAEHPNPKKSKLQKAREKIKRFKK